MALTRRRAAATGAAPAPPTSPPRRRRATSTPDPRGPSIIVDGWTLALAFTVLVHVAAAPFTKVEESFGMQAAHDLLFHGVASVDDFDHLSFPGVVPRSFAGPAAMAVLAAPFVLALRATHLSKQAAGVAVRCALASLGVASLCRLRGATARVHGSTAGVLLFALACVQFHLPFYLSRPLPNTYALIVTSLATADWVDASSPRRAIALLAATTALLRCDVLLLAGVLGLHLLVTRAVGVKEAIGTALVAGGAAALTSVLVDSYFWRRPLWPEGAVFWFNTAENRSSEWGTSPWHWYGTSALPRALLGGAPGVALAAVGAPPARVAVLTAAAFTVLYSFLPHKELRFLLPVLPLLNVAAAAGLASLWRRGGLAARAFVVGLLAASAAATAGFVAAASVNYPGGVALQRLHELASTDALHHPHAWPPVVHVGVLPAMTGVTRFGEQGAPWAYSKEEGLTDHDLAARGFTHALSGSPSLPGFDAIEAVPGYAGLDVPRSLTQLRERVAAGGMPLRVRTAPRVFVHRRRREETEKTHET